MSVRRLAATGWSWLLAFGVCSAQAEQVGRVEFDLPSAEWVLVASHPHQLLLDGGASYIPMHTAVYALPGKKNVPQALIVVTASDAGNRSRVHWVSDCAAPRAKYFVNDYGSNHQPNRRDCLVINAAFAPALYFAKDDWLLQALEARGWKLFKAGQSLRSTVTNEGGTSLQVHLATQKGFIGLSGNPRDAEDLHEVPPALVVWGEALRDAVRSSVYSMRGKVVLPPIEFDTN
jgi:hypothetical protein